MEHNSQILPMEEAKLKEDEFVPIFQDWVSSGEIWKLPTIYLESAAKLYLMGKINLPVAKANLN